METGNIRAEDVARSLQRVLESPAFVRNERLSRFLRFIVERQMEGREGDLKESIVGIEVFGRQPGFDPQRDSTVRSEASRLRARLLEYYAGAGANDTLIIELPKGGYTPKFRQVEAATQTTDAAPRTRSRLGILAALGALVIIAAVGGWWLFAHRNSPIPIAVLPLTNLSQNPADDYLADGITDEIIRNLSIIDGLAVRSQTSSFEFKGKRRNVRDAGKQLAADYIVEGSVLRAGQQLRINVQLIRVRDDFPLWSGRYNRELVDIFAIQDEVSRGVVNNLRLKLGRGRRRYETNVEAYDFYLRGRAAQVQSSFDKGVGAFKEAIAKDNSFAPAYAGLAASYVIRSGLSRKYDARGDELAGVRAAAEKAIELDPMLGEAYGALGMVSARDGQWEQSEKSFRHAITLDSADSTLHSDFAFHLLLPLGRIVEALEELRMAENADPLSPQVHFALAYTLLSAGRYDEAAKESEKIAASRPGRSETLGRARLWQGRFGEAIPLLVAAPGHNWGYLAFAYARAGRREEAEKLIAEAPGLYPDRRGAFQFALAFAGLGDKDRTIEKLERLAELGPVRVGRELTCPEFSLVRGDPRVKALRKKVGLPE